MIAMARPTSVKLVYDEELDRFMEFVMKSAESKMKAIESVSSLPGLVTKLFLNNSTGVFDGRVEQFAAGWAEAFRHKGLALEPLHVVNAPYDNMLCIMLFSSNQREAIESLLRETAFHATMDA